MCGRYTLAAPTPADIRARFPIGETVQVRRRYNVAPGDEVLAVTTDRDGQARGELLHWGLVPSWADPPNPRLKMINARVETVADRPAFRRAFGRFRCLIVADGFYEWQKPTSPARPDRRAFHITPAAVGMAGPDTVTGEDESVAAPIFAFAGLWSIWKDSGGRTLRSCAILTQAAHETLAALHDRMPVILPPGAEAAWLDAATPRAELLEVLSTSGETPLRLRAVGPAVNDARYDGPDCLAPPADAMQPATLF